MTSRATSNDRWSGMVAAARGVVAGTVATGAMSLVLEAGRRVTSFRRQPPELIVRTLLTGDPGRAVSGENVLALLAHFGYGASCGAVFSLLTRRRRRTGAVPGVVFALLLWLISYAGWVPAAGVMAPAQRDDRGRQLALVAGHVVYGAALSIVLRRMRRRDTET